MARDKIVKRLLVDGRPVEDWEGLEFCGVAAQLLPFAVPMIGRAGSSTVGQREN